MKNLSFLLLFTLVMQPSSTHISQRKIFLSSFLSFFFCGTNKFSVLFRHLHRRRPFGELNLYNNNESLFNEGKTSITIHQDGSPKVKKN